MISQIKAMTKDLVSVMKRNGILEDGVKEHYFSPAIILILFNIIFVSGIIGYQAMPTNILTSEKSFDMGVFIYSTFQLSFFYMLAWGLLIALTYGVIRFFTKEWVVPDAISYRHIAVLFGHIAIIITVFQMIVYLASHIGLEIVSLPLSALMYMLPFLVVYMYMMKFTNKETKALLGVSFVIVGSAVSFELLGVNPFVGITDLIESDTFDLFTKVD